MSIIEDAPKADFICNSSQYSLPIRANLNGLTALPDELLLEVLSHFPPDPITRSAASEAQIKRRQTLLSLSTVCQDLRRVFHPCLWQRVEVYTGMPKGDFVKELLRQLNVVTIQDPDLAQYVRLVDIEINGATLRPVFAELGRCFSLFPNLHTVKLITKVECYREVIAAAKRGFKKTISYSQIRSAILCPSIYPLIAACPNLESLITWETYQFHLPAFVKGLTALRPLSCPLFRVIAPILGSKTPRSTGESLRQITIGFDYTKRNQYETQFVKIIGLFPNVRTLVLYNGFYSTFDWPSGSIKSWQKVFLNLPPHVRQNLKEVIFSGHSREAVVVIPEC